nr:fibropellin-1-like [Lytechinus pictus]
MSLDCAGDNDPCQSGGTCENNACTCSSPYIGSVCDTVDCSGANPCVNGGTCQDGACSCTDNFDGVLCGSVDCSGTNPCMNEGTCGDGSCSCVEGFTGVLCDTVDCSGDNPCRNGGTCGNNTCTCAAGYTGIVCQSEVIQIRMDAVFSGETFSEVLGNTSSDEFMAAAASWETTLTTSYCEDQGYSESECPFTIKVVGFSNGSLVVNYNVFYSSSDGVDDSFDPTEVVIMDDSGSTLPSTFSRLSLTCGGNVCDGCESCPIVEAQCNNSQTPCQNEGICVFGECVCAPGYTGVLCANTIICSSETPCQNGGTCADGACTCGSGYAGDLCNATVRTQGDLQCYTCSASSVTDDCSAAIGTDSEVTPMTCYENQRCWTEHYENSTHTNIWRGCTDSICSTENSDGPSCLSTGDGNILCVFCCEASLCNNDPSSGNTISSSVTNTWLASLISLIIMYATFRT